jgi:NADPH2:quinone reductase
MKAARFNNFGKADEVLEIGDLERPKPGRGEVLVRLHASGVNPSDVKKRAGLLPGLLDEGYVIPHSDGAGIIEAVGTGVSAARIGERVWVYQAQHGRRFGTAAEYVSLPASRAARLPDNVDFTVGACLGIPAMTAHRCVFADGPVADQIVLVTGGAGRVGYYALQWAKQAGARVIATAGNASGEKACYQAGADHVVNHRADSIVDDIRKIVGPAGVDRVVEVEFGANLPGILEVLRVGGVIATYASTRVPEPTLPFFQMLYRDITIHIVLVYIMPETAKQQAMADIEHYLAADRLLHRIPHQLPLEDIAQAHKLIEEGGFGGCVVLNI